MYASLDQYRTRHSGCGRLKLDYREKKKGGERRIFCEQGHAVAKWEKIKRDRLQAFIS